MKQTQRILLSTLLILVCFVVYQQKTDLVNLRTENKNILQSITKIENDVYAKLDLLVLDSCGVITNGYEYGSCVAIDSNLFLTAGHCVGIRDAWIEVNEIKYDIDFQWEDSAYDIGFIRIKGKVPYLELGSMPSLLQEVYLVGTPYDQALVNTITRGIISHLDRDIFSRISLLQTDAEGAPGSSGCPLFDINGKIVGICVSGPNPGGGATLCEPVLHILEALERFYY